MARVKFGELPKELSAISTGWGVAMIARTWLGIAAALLLVSLHHSVPAYAGAVLLIGIMQYHLSVLGHHTTHRNVVKSRALNDFLARFLVHGPIGLPQDAMRRNHMIHHSHFERSIDPELDHYDLRMHGRATARGLVLWWASRWVGGEVMISAGRVLRGARGKEGQPKPSLVDQLRDWGPVAIVQLVLVVLGWRVSGHLWGYLVLWTLPQMTVLTGLMATRTTLEHADPADPPHRLMSFCTNIVERFLFAPFAFNYHAEHHLFPTIPAQHLGKVHSFLKERDALQAIRVQSSYTRRFFDVVGQLSARPLRPVSHESSQPKTPAQSSISISS